MEPSLHSTSTALLKEFEVLEDPLAQVQRLIDDTSDEEFSRLRAGNHRYVDQGKIFHMAIIDYLQVYNCTKSCERFCVPICK